MLRRLIAGLLVATMAAGCGNPTSTAPPAPSANTVAPPCAGTAAESGRAVAFGPGNDLSGLLFGTGTVGLVYAHQADNTSCAWLRTAATYAQRGYRTLIFDFAGFGASRQHATSFDADVAAAATYLREQSVTSIVLIGASMGGTAVLVAASKIAPPVAGVVAASAPVTYGAMGAVGVVLPPSLPVLLLAGSLDGGFAADARTLHDSIGPGAVRDLLIVESSSAHGVGLVAVDTGAPLRARDAVDEFLAHLA